MTSKYLSGVEYLYGIILYWQQVYGPQVHQGVFYNRPEAVGASFGEALQQLSGRFRHVIISFPGGKAGEAFATAAKDAFGN